MPFGAMNELPLALWSGGCAAFVLQQPVLVFNSSGCGKAAQTSRAADHAMAGDDQGDRVSTQCAAHCPAGAWISCRAGQVAIGDGLAEPDLAAGLQDCLSEAGQAIQIHWHIQQVDHLPAFEIRHDPGLEVTKQGRFFLGLSQACQQLPPYRIAAGERQAGPTDAPPAAGQAEEAPLSREEGIVHNQKK
jgi:hypothetical protein